MNNSTTASVGNGNWTFMSSDYVFSDAINPYDNAILASGFYGKCVRNVQSFCHSGGGKT